MDLYYIYIERERSISIVTLSQNKSALHSPLCTSKRKSSRNDSLSRSLARSLALSLSLFLLHVSL